MIKRFITDEELTIATALVSESMLRALPDPEDCTGYFTVQFEARIEQLKKTVARKAVIWKYVKSVVAAVLVVLIGFSMLCAFNTEVRAAVVAWFKETFGTYTSYWFNTEENNVLPEYELTWVPDGYEIIYDDIQPNSRTVVFQLGDDISASFSFSYYSTEYDSPLIIHTEDGKYDVEEVDVNGNYGEFYRSHSAEESHALVWFNEKNNTVLTILSYLSKDDILSSSL